MTNKYSIDAISDHGGNTAYYAAITHRSPEDILDFSVNINPDGIPEFLRGAIYRAIDNLDKYPEPYAETAIKLLAKHNNLPEEMFLLGNGSNALIHLLPKVLGFDNAVIITPSFSEYEKACVNSGVNVLLYNAPFFEELDFVELDKATPRNAALFIANPTNPTGNAYASRSLIRLAQKRPDITLIIDEAFIEYTSEECISSYKEFASNIIVIRSLTKFYALAGLRLGYLIANPNIVQKLKANMPQWSLNGLATECVKAITTKDGDRFRKETYQKNIERREKFAKALSSFPDIITYPSQANYLFFKSFNKTLFDDLIKKYGIAIRNCSNYVSLESGEYYRVGVRTDRDNNELINALNKIFKRSPNNTAKKRAKSLMIQGLSSDAGKSIIVSAFCRILQQDGFKVAPFKAQNMALNSAVTPDGLEIGRAQAVQAQACKIDPDTRMNPLLLKPQSDTGAQVIVRGKAIGYKEAKDFHNTKAQFFKIVCDAYDNLADEYDVIVLEGAGSPGEVNLKKNDIVNMAMARHAQSKVLLVGDIDRGGVYASFLGAYHTFDNWEKDLIHGFLVNKFRGDISLLDPAHDYITSFTGKSVVGVVPFLDDLNVPDEDSVALDVWAKNGKEAEITVALVWLPHISNFTDFAPLGLEPDIKLQLVRSIIMFDSPDIIIIPGSKSVVSDMDFLRKNGFEEYIQNYVAKGGRVLGICGGLQICGDLILDPENIESQTKSIKGFGLLSLTTTLVKDKVLSVKSGVSSPFGDKISGYEIHHGLTKSISCEDAFICPNGTALGFKKGKIWTTYLHGLFDTDTFRWNFIEMLRKENGLALFLGRRHNYDIDKALDRLADVVRDTVDIEQLYKVIGLG